MALVIVAFGRGIVLEGGIDRFRVGIVFESVGRAQRFAFQAQISANLSAGLADTPGRVLAANHGIRIAGHRLPIQSDTIGCRTSLEPAMCRRGYASSHGKRVCWKGQTERTNLAPGRLPKGTLLLGDFRFPDVGNESGVGSSTGGKVVAGFVEA